MTLRELERWLILAVAAYHADVHTGLRQSPAARWDIGTEAGVAPPAAAVGADTEPTIAGRT
ncbi:hypothetical protein [Rhodococcoides yunnanense]|uniref:hypothetical protein n=1 Tax=Rhodococcoides yunnanense TaxID=278209 RepID=UPI003FA70AC1